MFPVIEVPSDASETPEQVGSKYKFWYAAQTLMLKLAREGTGEAWAEKIAAELCQLLGLPHADYELAVWRGSQGTITTNIVQPPGRLVLGNELLASFIRDYPGAQKYRQRQHTVGRVSAVLNARNLKVPLGVSANHPLNTPFDFFVGYTLLDAWIGNTDRHHENWAVVVAGNDAVHLSPTFDHASSLGRELTDDVRLERLQTRDKRRDVLAYISKARSALYRSATDQQPLLTVDAFEEVARRSPAGRAYWLEKLAQVPEIEIHRIIDEVPIEFMSEPARQFARAILLQNKETLLACAKDSQDE